MPPQVIEQCKQNFEDALTERTESLISDIEKLKNRVRELDDLGDVNNMPVYVSDMRALRRKLTELEGVTEWINGEEALFKFPISTYPEIQQLQVRRGLDPEGSLIVIRPPCISFLLIALIGSVRSLVGHAMLVVR